mmetsp:Transcript_26265/g.52841  ORF Transcript_26265/g.52841 Transcript_26265/m.52841 type:complete len:348 (+) Transcript_26265:78-1121(+)
MIEEEWEQPVGLTAEHAICVGDSSSDDEGDHVTSCNDNPINNDEAGQTDGGTTINRASSISSYFKSSSAPEQEDAAAESRAQIMTDPISYPKRSIDNKPEPPLPQTSENTDNQNDSSSNPFAAFAFNADEISSISTSWQSKKRTLQIPHNTTSSTARSQKKVKQVKQSLKQKDNKKTWSIAELQTQSTKTAEGDEQLEKEEHRQVLIQKWHSFSDPTAPIEERRFQVLIAARIHARCQEPIVHKAMLRLREYFANQEDTNEGTAQSLSAQCLSQCDPESDIAPLLSSVLFGNVKAQHVVQAAQDVLSKFRGQVPESLTSLQDITGIGPKLSQILNIVNRRDTYTSQA